MRRQARLLFEADHHHRVGAQTANGLRAIDRHVTAADHHDLISLYPALAAAHGLEEGKGMHDAGQVFSGDSQLLGLRTAERHQHRIVLLQQFIQRQVLPQRPTPVEPHSHSQQPADLPVQNPGRQPELGHRPPEHAARFGLGVVKRHGVAMPPQIEGRRQPGGAGADNGDFLGGRPTGLRIRGRLGFVDFRQVALQAADIDGVAFLLFAVAVALAGLGA